MTDYEMERLAGLIAERVAAALRGAGVELSLPRLTPEEHLRDMMRPNKPETLHLPVRGRRERS